jgi:hypothetical protein
MNVLLESLIGEYKDLKVKLDKVGDLILMYGGEIPDLPHEVTQSRIESKKNYKGEEYPAQGTWKDKILFVLNAKSEPMTAKDISKAIEALEGFIMVREAKLDTTHILKTVTQYTSSMAKDGEIGVDNTQFRNKYFLIKK